LKKLILALLLLLLQTIALAESVVEVISVYYRPASEIEPLLLPLLEGSDHIVANGDSLIVKTSPERLQTISNLIRKLDIPLNNLLITVIQSDSLTADQLNAGIGFDVYGGGNPNQFGGRVYGQGAIVNSTRNNRNTQTIRTTDGATAHIKVGAVYPLTNYQVYPGAYGYPNMSSSTQLVEATTGFAVTPRLVGQQVVMDVSPWSDRFNNQGQLQTQAAETSIRANIGEWVDLGGVDESGQSNSNGILSYTRQTRQNNLHILVKVDVVN
jgi:type II secretory pathway component GspD/PulD (secretin)